MESDLKRVIEIQNIIYNKLNSNNGVTSHFFQGKNTLDLVTYNPISKEIFLLHRYKHNGLVRLDELYEILLDYVIKITNVIHEKKVEDIGNSYTVIWNGKDGKSHKSFFCGKNMDEVVTKFYYKKEGITENYNILEIKQNPLS